MTIGQLLIRRALPPEMRDQHHVLDNNGVKALFQTLAEKHPEQYRDVSHKLLQIGRRVSTESNGMSVGISDLASSKHTLEVRERLNNRLQEIYAQDIPETEKNKQVITLAIAAQKELSGKVFDEAHGNKNPLAIMAKTGVRGNASNVNSLIGADMLYVDNSGKEIPIPVTHNYSEGLTPAEYFAGAFGARKGTIDVKMCLHGATRVRMADWSIKAIKDILPGEYVMGSDTAGRFRPVCVTNKFENGDKLCNTYTFRVGNAKTICAVDCNRRS
jgi:DNA-directed RNA polymerase subunit beta'